MKKVLGNIISNLILKNIVKIYCLNPMWKNKKQGMNQQLFILTCILNLSPFKTTFYLRVYMTVAAYKVDFYTVAKKSPKGCLSLEGLMYNLCFSTFKN